MSSVEHITSRQNPLVGHIRRLNASRAYRRERGEFVCDGPKLLAEALRWGAEITAVVAEEGRSVPCPPGAREVSVPPGAAEEPVHHRDTPGGAVPVQGSGSERAGQAYRHPLSGAGWGPGPGQRGYGLGAQPTPSERTGSSCCPAVRTPFPPKQSGLPWGPVSVFPSGKWSARP